MMVKYLIAFSAKPKPGFIRNLIDFAESEGVHIQGALGRPGPRCYNLGLLLPQENEPFINALTLALMPARWTTTQDDIPVDQFTMEE